MLDLIIANTPLFLTGVFVFGLLIGSFLNVVILRLPARLEHDWRCQCKELLEIENVDDEKRNAPPDLMWSRSQCPQCGHFIKAHENIPLLSYIYLMGRCIGSASRARVVRAVSKLQHLEMTLSVAQK